MGLPEPIRGMVKNVKRAVVAMDDAAKAFVELQHLSIADAIRLSYRKLAGVVREMGEEGRK